MKKRHHFFSLATLSLALGLSFTSCTDNCFDSNGNNGDGGNDSSLTDQEFQTRQSLLCLLGMTADVDSLPDNWNNGYTAEPTIGQEASEGNPYVRLVATSSVEDACRYYQFMTSQQSDGTLTSDTWTNDSIGTLKFTAENQTDLYATVDVDVKQLPHLTQIRFVPASALGNNDGEGYWYSPGDIILQELPGEEPTYWMCVRPCIEGSKGRSHWCTLQLNSTTQKNPNFIEFEGKTYGKLTLPTKLAKSQGDAARMIHHYFNELLVLTDTTRFKNLSSFGELASDDFSSKQLRDLQYLWDDFDIWSKISPNFSLQEKLNVNYPQAYAFFYGYSKSFNLLSHNDYNVYCLSLLPVVNKEYKNTFVSAIDLPTSVEPEVGQTKAKDFSKINESGTMSFNLTTNDKLNLSEENKQKVYVVKHRTGAQLENRWLSTDNKPGASLSDRHSSNYITDILVQKQIINTSSSDLTDNFVPFFAYGDQITSDSRSGEELLCVRPAPYQKLQDITPSAPDKVTYSYFITSKKDKKEFSDFDYISLNVAQYVNTLLLDSYLVSIGNEEVQPLIQLQEGEQNLLYETAAKSLFNIVSKINNKDEVITFGRGTDEETNKTYYYVTSTYNVLDPTHTYDKVEKTICTLRYYPGGKVDKQGNNKKLFFTYTSADVNATCVDLLAYQDAYTYTEGVSKTRTLIATGSARRTLRKGVREAYEQLKF